MKAFAKGVAKSYIFPSILERNKRTDGRNFPREKRKLLEKIKIRPAEVIVKWKCLKTQFLKVDITRA